MVFVTFTDSFAFTDTEEQQENWHESFHSRRDEGDVGAAESQRASNGRNPTRDWWILQTGKTSCQKYFKGEVFLSWQWTKCAALPTS